ncbi:HK97 gp10 family phage protein [Micromonospora sp. NPDC049645]|uniref:HK97 gp10 family phage protein n=1 Tax=Micromonospora sp. NPDC049645 TaxID=3155508 RepID=UPI0034499B87
MSRPLVDQGAAAAPRRVRPPWSGPVAVSTFRINQAVVDELLRGRSGPVVRHVEDICNAVRNEAVRNVQRDTGALAASLESTVNVHGRLVVGRVGSSLHYARYIHDGTGIYGPKQRPIVPVTAKALRFKPGRMIGPLPAGKRGTSPEDRGDWIFARSVKGVPPHPFLVEAFERACPYPIRIAGR